MLAEQLVEITVFLFGVERRDLMGGSRVARVVEARQALAWALRQNDWSLEAIGAFLHRDHTTIIHSLKTIDRRVLYNKRLAERLAVLAEPTIDTAKGWQARIVALEARVAELERQLSYAPRAAPLAQ